MNLDRCKGYISFEMNIFTCTWVEDIQNLRRPARKAVYTEDNLITQHKYT